MLKCSVSADSRMDNSASEDSMDDENMETKENGYHDVENEAEQETDEDPERILSGKLSESSGYTCSDLYDFKVITCSICSNGLPLYIVLILKDTSYLPC